MIQPVAPEGETSEKLKSAILASSAEAVRKLKEMRTAEGAALADDLEVHCKRIKEDIDKVYSRTGTVLKEYQKKLRKRVEELMSAAKLQLDEETLAREVAVFAEKSDVSEEIARLDSHLSQFEQSSRGDGQTGRRLEFIAQEMLRETNTIASKASDVEIARLVVNIKCHIDRIKEQVQNVE